MSKIFVLCGPSGSGKTFVLRSLLESPGFATEVGRDVIMDGVRRNGKYSKHSAMRYRLGSNLVTWKGLDGHADHELMIPMINGLLAAGMNVLVDNRRFRDVAGTIDGWVRSRPGDFVYLVLDTPVDVCAARIAQRRASGVAGARNRKSTPEEEAARTHKTTHEKVVPKLRGVGVSVVMIPYTSAAETTRHTLERAGAL